MRPAASGTDTAAKATGAGRASPRKPLDPGGPGGYPEAEQTDRTYRIGSQVTRSPAIPRRAALLLLAGLAGCGGVPVASSSGASAVPGVAPMAGEADIAALARAIAALGPEVDADEAARAARLAYAETHRLAIAWRVTDPPLIHNTKVNMGLRPRGLCWHWAVDLGAAMEAPGFRTLDIHQAIANADNPFRIEHSSAVISAAGDPMRRGIVLDPWREGGRLTWVPVTEDTRYRWVPRADVWAMKRARRAAR